MELQNDASVLYDYAPYPAINSTVTLGAATQDCTVIIPGGTFINPYRSILEFQLDAGAGGAGNYVEFHQPFPFFD